MLRLTLISHRPSRFNYFLPTSNSIRRPLKQNPSIRRTIQRRMENPRGAESEDGDTRRKQVIRPKVGILVATEVERQAVLKKMRPPKNKRAVLQVYSGNNTCFVGRLGITDIVLCMTAMGSIGRDSSMMVTAEMIES